MPVGINWGATNSLLQNSLSITSGNRFVAGHLIDETLLVFDRQERQIVLRIENDTSIPRFMHDGNSLVLIPSPQYAVKPVRWYQLTGGRWSLAHKSDLELEEREHLCHIGDQYLVTAKWLENRPEWVNQFPDILQAWIARVIPFQSVQVRLWGVATGELVCITKRRFSITQKVMGFRFESVTCSHNGQFLVLKTDLSTYTIWTSAITKPWSCWLTMLVTIIIALQVGRPRFPKLHSTTSKFDTASSPSR
ncbi:MAG: hypothetical protein U0796_14565 [Gemmatales bacterium]